MKIVGIIWGGELPLIRNNFVQHTLYEVIRFALTEGGDLSFIITGSEESEGLLSGSKVNYLKDEMGLLSPLFLSNGSVSSGEINQSVSPEQENPKKKSPGFAFFISTLALIITSGYYAGRRQ